jgi:GTPase Era involved in 16S rRNA processing
MDAETFPAVRLFLEYVEIEKFDAFLIFTAEKLNKRHMILAKEIKSRNKPFFLVRTKIDNDDNAEKREEEFNEEAMLRELRASFAENLKEFLCDENDLYLISNHHPEKWDFLKLMTAITDALPSPQKVCFSKIPKIQKLIALENFQNFLQGTIMKLWNIQDACIKIKVIQL